MLFDFWDTLVYTERKESEKLKRLRITNLTNALLEAGFPATPETIERCLDQINAESDNIRRAGREVDLHNMMRMLMELLRTSEQNQDLEKRLWDTYANSVFSIELKVRDGAETVLQTLRTKGYKIGLICNTYHSPSSVLRKIIQNFGLHRYFDVLVFSDEYGIPKPRPEIFLEALSRIGAEPSEAAHVGDRPDLDVLGAKNSGVKAIYLKITDKPYPSDFPKPDATIETLSQIPQILENIKSSQE